MQNNNGQIKREIRFESLCFDYGKEQFLNWCRSLNFFRLCRSHPYPDDLKPDRFISVTIFENDAELEALFDSLKIEVRIEEGNILKTKDIVSTFSGKTKVFGVYCYIEVNKILRTLMLEVSGTETDQFSLDDTTFQRAKIIDGFLSTLQIEFISSPNEDDYCITPEFYPEVWN